MKVADSHGFFILEQSLGANFLGQHGPEAIMEITLGTCPTREHTADYRRCGFVGCIDLREWANDHRYRFRLEESYKAESNTHIRGDGRWFVEILCKRGLIYPKGGREILAFTKSTDAWKSLLKIGVQPHQVGDRERIAWFLPELLDQVAAILRPKRRKTISPEHLKALQDGRKSLCESGQIDQERTQVEGEGKTQGDPLGNQKVEA
jgi:hypothetical protein